MSIYEKIGGAPSASAAVDDFYRRVLDDADLVPYFDGVDVDRLRAHQRSFLAAAFGGPEAYTGRGMAEAHVGLAVTAEAFGRVVEHLVSTLRSLGVDEETVAEIGAALTPLEGEIVTAAPSP